MFGYKGKMLDVDLTTGTIKKYTPDKDILKNFLSGVGINTKILHDNIPAGCDPLGPENVLVFGVGVLVGTNIDTAARTEASAKSPATGLLGTSNSGAYWGSELKYAGFDGIIIRGSAQSPLYLYIKDGQVELRDANHLWGQDCWETIAAIQRDLQDHQVQVACIGPAGENLVGYASIENGYWDAWGRTGLGAVMGSKKLKAIAVRGTGGIKVAHREAFLNAVQDTKKAIYGSPFFEAFRRYGTMLATIPYHEFAALPGRNFQTGQVNDWLETRSRKVVAKYSKRGISCISCPIACAHWVEVPEGKYQGLKVKDMEVTPVIAFGAQCDIGNMPAIAKLTEVCQRLGMDMVSAGSTVAFTMELFQRGLLTKEDIGFTINWGDEEATFQLLELIATRQGIGDVLAEGTKRAGEKIPGANYYAMHIKGLELPLADARGRWSTWTFGQLTNVRGGDHLRNRNPVENLRYNDNPEAYRTEKFAFSDSIYHDFDMPVEIKARVFDNENRDVNIAQMSKWSEDLISVYNALGICIRPPVLQAVGPSLLSRLYGALTGIEITPEVLMMVGERIWNLQKLFNIRQGEQKEEAKFPDRFYQEELPGKETKTKKLAKEKVAEVLGEYYLARGWDKQSGVPKESKLKELGLEL